ncbi:MULTISPECIES: DUF6979 family protein [Pectobacterium]|uniref:DUF6979 family protein n=1 Tax=Pectobacterium TaxID=122277 RepID=UPI002114F649|nr:MULTISPECIES: hypothetical protein [Pectobacterium]MDY4367643.1 hypothetical protein [Pectobacterium brasiliense]MDY7057174.1 hypothetical protein [Pectobacterium brasiliense]UUE46367.1 hypothetical protein L0Y28_06960 [Pectobacterium aroidearum]UUE50588.1 hypothetical protein L0Y23_06970 [Pectobacterium aroidearum]UUE54793.1 hypothetical protein L0Y30_06970 [Pectobacterium aroidearum]
MSSAKESVYGCIAIDAVKICHKEGIKPDEAWKRVVAGKDKCCPRSAFLGLCEDGWVKGIQDFNYFKKRSPNKCYAVFAAKLIMKSGGDGITPNALWKVVIEGFPGEAKEHNQQMSVVLALKEYGFLNKLP